MPGRRGRGLLEADVKRVTDAFVTGEYVVPDGKPFTAYRIAQALQQMDSLPELPSVGAVSYVLDRWDEIGFATMTRDPYAFSDYTEEGRTEGLAALHARAKEARKEARRAAKAAEKAAEEREPTPIVGVVTPEGIVPAEVADEPVPGACGDPDCPVLHEDPANPIHPPGGPWGGPARDDDLDDEVAQEAPEAPQEAPEDDDGILPPVIVDPTTQPAEGEPAEAPRKWQDEVLSDAYSEG